MDEGLVDAVKAFFEAGKNGDYEEAAQAFKDACSLSEEEGEGEGEGDTKEGGIGKMGADRSKPLSLLIGIGTAKKK